MASFLRPTALKLRNFKGIAELDLTLDESLTLLAGVNGVGKTSVLQALLASVTYAWHHINHRHPVHEFRENVVRAGSAGTEIALELELSDNSTRELRMTVDGTIPSFDGGWLKLAPVFREFEPSLPLVVYYEQNRVAHAGSSWRDVSVSSSQNRKTSLHTTVSSPPEFKAWFFEKEADEGIEIRQRQNLRLCGSGTRGRAESTEATGRI